MIFAFIIFLLFLSWTGYWLLLEGYLPLTNRLLMLLGTFLMTLSVLVPLSIVINLLPSTFFLNFISFEFILLGMMFFVFGIGGLGHQRTRKLGEDGLGGTPQAYSASRNSHN